MGNAGRIIMAALVSIIDVGIAAELVVAVWAHNNARYGMSSALVLFQPSKTCFDNSSIFIGVGGASHVFTNVMFYIKERKERGLSPS